MEIESLKLPSQAAVIAEEEGVDEGWAVTKPRGTFADSDIDQYNCNENIVMGKLETTSTASDECDSVDCEVSDGDDVKLIFSSAKHQTSLPEVLHFMFPVTQGEDARRFQFSNLHPLVTIILYTVVFWVTLVLIQKFDDVGSGWEARKVEETQECRIEQTCEGIHVKTPTCNDEHVQNVVPGWERKPMVKDDPGFCTPTSPWFWYDLGGTMCVCEKSWDVRAYWEKTMTSFAFNFPHFMTPFQIYLVSSLHSIQYNSTHCVFNWLRWQPNLALHPSKSSESREPTFECANVRQENEKNRYISGGRGCLSTSSSTRFLRSSAWPSQVETI